MKFTRKTKMENFSEKITFYIDELLKNRKTSKTGQPDKIERHLNEMIYYYIDEYEQSLEGNAKQNGNADHWSHRLEIQIARENSYYLEVLGWKLSDHGIERLEETN